MDGTHEGMERMMATAGEWEVTGQRVLVTGASSGLGLAMARALAAGGARVALGARDAGRLGEAVRSLGETTADVRAVPLDVRDSASIARAIAVIADAWGGLDVLVNNAGIGMRTVNPAFLTDPQPFWQVSEEGFTAVIDTNLTGYFRVASAAVPLLLEAERGKIINISMNHETMRRRGFVPYGPSRAGAESLSLIMAEDLRPFGVDVNMLLPGGATATGMIPDDVPHDLRARLLSPNVMAEPMRYLSSHASDGVTGARIVATEFATWLRERQEAQAG
jgi:NAD(P)-dependent dehydrogenase (short-subunit alcohol dehydrogenase family)